jgi:hypothetical protein
MKFHKPCPVGADLFHEDGQADRNENLTLLFAILREAPTNPLCAKAVVSHQSNITFYLKEFQRVLTHFNTKC